MAPIRRRRALQLAGGSLSALVAGCVGGSPSTGTDEQTETPTDEPTETRTDEPTETPTAATEVTGSEQVRYPSSPSEPDWAGADAVGHVALAASRERARALLAPFELPEERREPVVELLRETDFERSLLALVETVGPNGCYRTVELSNLALSDDRLVGDASAVDESDGKTACTEALTYPATLVRVTFDGTPPERATFTITDGWGESADVTGTVEDRIGPDPDDLAGHVRPDDDPVVREPLSCDREGFKRHESWVDDPPWGLATDDDGAPTFALRVDRLEAAVGETVTVAMTNVSDSVLSTGNRHKYSFQTYTDSEWEDVRGATDGDPLPYTDEAISHVPGDGFEWTLALTEEGLVADHVHADRLVVCPDLEPGRYRFVFWEPAVAVAFDLVE
ncbi:hypothetical protein IL252_06515 [Halomicrobium sp. IBSBa]|uniref:hypothetical protein n=1 Tax=Halomicrobium sp. IBSBa TaxID=2778916 RepID=UPI001ABF0210|nr:hypothetical protein [Halomicrobium sp. IBSBa]MBO4247471.1 hypothetical protein [Halomicrobium sp. IBSBa]